MAVSGQLYCIFHYKNFVDTTEQIKACRANPRRPSFGNDNSYPEIFKLAIECWKEKPEERPTFPDIRKRLIDLRR